MTPQEADEKFVTQPVAPTSAAPRERWFAPLINGSLTTLWPAMVVTFVGVLAIGFVMSYHGLFTFGDEIMRWPRMLSALAPIGLDIFSMVGLIATFLTRDAPWRTKAYCWLVFGVTVALSVAGNAVPAIAHLDRDAAVAGTHTRWGYAQVAVVAGAALWPALSAAALHLLIVVKRHLDEARDKVKNMAELAERTAADEALQRARAIELAATGATAAAILADLGLGTDKRRSVERWTEPIRAALAARQVAVPAKGGSRRTVTARTDQNGAQ